MDYFDIDCIQIAFQGINEILASLVHSDLTFILIIRSRSLTTSSHLAFMIYYTYCAYIYIYNAKYNKDLVYIIHSLILQLDSV